MIAHEVRTADGWRLGLWELPAAGAARGTVYIQHGLGATPANYDLPGVFSPARWLASRGWRVFLGALRGRPPGEPAAGRVWSFSEYVAQDAPALAGAVRRLAGPFHWVGHSLGGILGLTHAALSPGDALSVTTLASALHYGVGPSGFRTLAPLRGRLAWLRRVPNRWLHRALSPLWASGLVPAFHYHQPNLGFRAAMTFHWTGQTDLCVDELEELGSTLDGEGILCRSLGRRLPEAVARVPVPWLAVAGDRDTQCPPETARWTFERVSAPRKDWLLVEGAGHFDLAVSALAEERTWPRVEAFLDSAARNAILSPK